VVEGARRGRPCARSTRPLPSPSSLSPSELPRQGRGAISKSACEPSQKLKPAPLSTVDGDGAVFTARGRGSPAFPRRPVRGAALLRMRTTMKFVFARAKQTERRDQRIEAVLAGFPSLEPSIGALGSYHFVEWCEEDGDTAINIEVRDEGIVERLASELRACGAVTKVYTQQQYDSLVIE
jgi:hypothetical protein